MARTKAHTLANAQVYMACRIWGLSTGLGTTGLNVST